MKALPFLLRRLRELGAVDAWRVESLAKDGILTLSDLQLAFAEQRPIAADPLLRRAGAALAEERRQLTLGRSWEVLEMLLAEISGKIPDLETLEASGGVRRFEPLPQDLVVVGRTADPSTAAAALARLPIFNEVIHRAERRLIVLFQGHELDVRLATRDEFGTLLFTTTGPPDHVAQVQRRRGPRLCATEADVYAQAGLRYQPPEVRGSDALEAVVPPLVTREDIRGDLHMHTTYSDGSDSLREMVAACCALGYEYIAITDHSERAAAGRTLDARSLERQRNEIARVREQFPQIAILHGIEADILEDGTIDCPDDTMASLDIVLASLHERGRDSGRRLTERCIQAIQHPLVSVITHPQNQLVGRRSGYDMDYDAIYEAAAATGAALEIDGAPAHLDLDGAHSRAAVTRGVTVTIDSDCHRAQWLDRQMRLGIGTARRGWVEARQVLNTRSLGEIRAFVARKRGTA